MSKDSNNNKNEKRTNPILSDMHVLSELFEVCAASFDLLADVHAANHRQRTVSLLCPCVTTQYGQPFLVVLTKSRLSVLTLLALSDVFDTLGKKFSSHVHEECLAYPTRLRPNGRFICLIDSKLLVFF